MTLNQLASKIARIEGKRSQARIGDIRETLGILCDMVHANEPEGARIYENPVVELLRRGGQARAKRKKGKKK